MDWLRELARRLKMLVHRRQFDTDLEEEMRLHLELRRQEQVGSGLTADDARAAARRRFGNPIYLKEESHLAWGWEWLENLGQDVHYGVRVLRKSPGFTAVAVLTLALGIGATTSIFSVIKAVILNPLPFRQPQNLVHIWESNEHYHRGEQAWFSTAHPESLFHWRAQSQSFERVSAYRRRSMFLTGSTRAELVSAHDVYDQFFETLETPAYLGRTLQPRDYEPSAAHVVVLSNPMWVRRFGGDPGVIGRRISLDRQSYEIVGVMPVGFYPLPGGGYGSGYPDLWTPHWANQGEKNDHKTWGLYPIARLKPGVTWEQAQTELDVISARVSQDQPWRKMGGTVVPMDAQLIGSSWKLLLLLAAAVTLLLLIACANVANLLLSRAVDREKEFAVRTALGAGRGHLLVQLFTESLIFAAAAAALGIGFASAATSALLAVLPRAAILPRLDSVKVDLTVLAFACALTLCVSLLFSLIPLIRASKSRPHEALKLEGRTLSAGKSKRRLGQVFVVSEFVLSLVLLILGVLLVESFVRLQRVDRGFDASNLLVFRIDVPNVKYGEWIAGGKNASRIKLDEQLEQIVSSVPGVESVAAGGLPLTQQLNPWGVLIEGRETPPSGTGTATGDTRATGIQWVNPQSFQTLRLKLVRGRFFDEHDHAEAPSVSVINETFARTFFPNEDPIGQRVTVWFAKTTIVGVVSDFKMNALDRKPNPYIFWSVRQIPLPDTWVMARTKMDFSSLAGVLRQRIQALDSDLPVSEMRSMNEMIADSLWVNRLSATLIGLVAVLAIILAAAGIYSVMSYSVSQRRKEVGIRIAFGAHRGQVFGLIMGETCRLAILGCVLGCAAAFIAGRLTTSISYLALASNQSQQTLNPWAFVVSSLFLLVVALLASLVPARRALGVDPILSLRYE